MRFNLLLLFTLTLQFVFSQTTENTVTLTTSGTGKTLEEAKNNALRSAIEQAFGAFISSKTEILNDQLVSDEITSVASGNVESFDIISQIVLPDNSFALTLLSVISVTKLTSYCENKGIQIEFKGSLFATNIKLQKLNEEAELKAVIDLCIVSSSLLKKSLDYTVTTSEPIQVGNQFELKYSVECKSNINYTNFESYFINSIKGISMTQAEVSEYEKLNKTVFQFQVSNPDIQTIYLRNRESSLVLQNFFIRANGFMTAFAIENDFEKMFIGHENINRWCLDCNNDKRWCFDCKDDFGDGKIGLVDFRFWDDELHSNKLQSVELFLRYVEDVRIYSSFFTQDKTKRWSFDAEESMDALGTFVDYSQYKKFPYPRRMIGYSDYNPTRTIGILYLNGPKLIKHFVRQLYTLEQLGKISFVKITPL